LRLKKLLRAGENFYLGCVSLNVGDKITLKIHDLAFGGEGVGRQD